ncbi:MAG TPA: hypothetical protein VEH52_10265 [Gaiellaceae bacterium]|nr:hypothetical protein [Gaiellaceae bacterium]
MRVFRLLAVTVGAGVLIALVAPGVGTSFAPAKKGPKQASCAQPETTSGVEVVFGRFKTNAAALKRQAQMTKEGFLHSKIVQECSDFKVVIRGMETYDIAIALQSEARKGNLLATVECVKGTEDVGQLEVVFGHRRDRPTATALVQQAAREGFTGLELQPDPCGGFEIMIKGFSSRAQAEEFVQEANAAGFNTVIEQN